MPGSEPKVTTYGAGIEQRNKSPSHNPTQIPQHPTGSHHNRSFPYGRSYQNGDPNRPPQQPSGSHRDYLPGGDAYDNMRNKQAFWDIPRGKTPVKEWLEEWEQKWQNIGGEPHGKSDGKPKI